MTKQELKDLLLENFVNEDGDLDLRELDFGDFDGDVYISNMKVKKDLLQHNQQVGADLYQDHQKVDGDIYQKQIVKDGGPKLIK